MAEYMVKKREWYVMYQDGAADNEKFDSEKEATEYWKKHYKKKGHPCDSCVTSRWIDAEMPTFVKGVF